MKTSRMVLIGAVVSLAILAASVTHAAVPGVPAPVSPSGKVAGSTITFLWKAVTGATKYQLQVKSGSVIKLNTIFTAAQANCSDGTGTCSAQATFGGATAALTWNLRAGNTAGFSVWSAAKNLVMTDEMRTPISSLPYTISSPGSYFVTGNLTSAGTGITVNANDATIDLGGYVLTGPGSGDNHGVHMVGRKNVEIRNGTIKNFGTNGIYEASGGYTDPGHRVIGVRVIENGSSGIFLVGNQHFIENCTAINNAQYGIYVDYYSIIRECTCTGNQNGIYCYSGSTISDNIASQNNENGIRAIDGNSVINNIAMENSNHGIMADGYNTIKNNTTSWNKYSGIQLGTYNVLDGNTSYLNNQSGGAYPNISDCVTCASGVNVK